MVMNNEKTDQNPPQIIEANINYYAAPFIHPKRKMEMDDFIYLLQGEWKFGQGGKEYHLRKDSLLILPAGQTHKGLAPCAPGTKTLYFHAMPKEERKEALLLDASDHKELKRIFSEIVRNKLSGKQRKADLHYELLLCEMEEISAQPHGEGIAQKIERMIQNHPEKFYSNEELADRLNVSVKTAETKFKAFFGQTIHRYMLDFKMREAISYFENFPEISIKEIAYNLGFYDEYHFSKQFKKAIGQSPRDYKKSIR